MEWILTIKPQPGNHHQRSTAKNPRKHRSRTKSMETELQEQQNPKNRINSAEIELRSLSWRTTVAALPQNKATEPQPINHHHRVTTTEPQPQSYNHKTTYAEPQPQSHSHRVTIIAPQLQGYRHRARPAKLCQVVHRGRPLLPLLLSLLLLPLSPTQIISEKVLHACLCTKLRASLQEGRERTDLGTVQGIRVALSRRNQDVCPSHRVPRAGWGGHYLEPSSP